MAVDEVEARLRYYGWDKLEEDASSQVVHGIVPRDVAAGRQPLEDLVARPNHWHPVVNNLILDSGSRFAKREWFDTEGRYWNLASNSNHGGFFYAYQTHGALDRKIAELRCYPDGTIIIQSWIVGPWLPTPEEVVSLDEICSSLAATMYFVKRLYEEVGAREESLVRTGLARAGELDLLVQMSSTDAIRLQPKNPEPFMRVPGELEVRSNDDYLATKLEASTFRDYCLSQVAPLYERPS